MLQMNVHRDYYRKFDYHFNFTSLIQVSYFIVTNYIFIFVAAWTLSFLENDRLHKNCFIKTRSTNWMNTRDILEKLLWFLISFWRFISVTTLSFEIRICLFFIIISWTILFVSFRTWTRRTYIYKFFNDYIYSSNFW